MTMPVSQATVRVPLTIRRRGGRKQIIGPDGTVARQGECGAGVVPVNGDPALIKALARGFRWRRMLEEGRYASISEMNRPGFVGGSHFQIGWSRYEQNNEQILP